MRVLAPSRSCATRDASPLPRTRTGLLFRHAACLPHRRAAEKSRHSGASARIRARPGRNGTRKEKGTSWPIIWKDDCSKSATAASCARAGSARIPTMAPAIMQAWHFDKGHDRRRRCRAAAPSRRRPHPGQRAERQVSAPRSISTTAPPTSSRRRCWTSTPASVAVRSPISPSWSARSFRSKACRSPSPCNEGAGRSRIGDVGYRRARALPGPSRGDHHAHRHDLLDRSRRAGLRRQGHALPLEEPRARTRHRPDGHNALQSTFVFDC